MSVLLKDVYRLALQLSPEDRKRLVQSLTSAPPPVNARQVITLLEAHAAELRAMNVERIGVFGSVARGEAGPVSDIDILVTLRQASFRDYMRVKFYLEDLLTYPVDLVMESTLRDELRPAVLKEVMYVQGL